MLLIWLLIMSKIGIESALPYIPLGVNEVSAQRLPNCIYTSNANGGIKIHERRHHRPPLEGINLMLSGEVEGIATLPPNSSPEEVLAAGQIWQYHLPDRHQKDLLYITSDAIASQLESELIQRPIVRFEQLKGIFKEQEINAKYGVNFPLDEYAGTYQLVGLVFDRLSRNRLQGNKPKHTYFYSLRNRNDKVPGGPRHLAQLMAQYPDTYYVQIEDKSSQLSSSASSLGQGLADPVDKAISKGLTPSPHVMGKSNFFELTPFATGKYTQNLVMMITASELGEKFNLTMSQVLDVWGLKLNDNLLEQEMSQDYETLLKIIREVCYIEGVNLIDATPAHYKRINDQLQKTSPRLGQLFGSIYSLIREGLVNWDEITKVEKDLLKKSWPGAREELRSLMSETMLNPKAEQDPAKIYELIELAILQDEQTSQPFRLDTSTLTTYDKNTDTRERAFDHSTLTTKHRDIATRYLEHLNFFNPDNLRLDRQPLKEIIPLIREYIRNSGMTLILPAHREIETIEGIVEHYAQIFPVDRIVVVSKDEKTRTLAKKYGVNVVDEYEVFDQIDFEKLEELGILPQGSRFGEYKKGATILAGYLYLLSIGKIDRFTQVALCDTDFDNVKEYLPVEYNTLPLLLGQRNEEFIATHIAKTGKARKLPIMLSVLNRMLNSDNEVLKKLARNLKRRVWNLAGERILRADMLNMSFPLRYGIESFLNWRVMHQELEEPVLAVAEVANPVNKHEKGAIDEGADQAMAQWTAGQINHAVDFYVEFGVFPFEFDLEHQKTWNAKHAQNIEEITVSTEANSPEEEDQHRPNKTYWKLREVFIPSPGALTALEIINWHGIKSVKNSGRSITEKEKQAYPNWLLN